VTLTIEIAEEQLKALKTIALVKGLSIEGLIRKIADQEAEQRRCGCPCRPLVRV
jgi:hypothetical protein